MSCFIDHKSERIEAATPGEVGHGRCESLADRENGQKAKEVMVCACALERGASEIAVGNWIINFSQIW